MDWTARPEPFSRKFAEDCARDMVPNLLRCEPKGRAWNREIREFAEVVKEVMRKERELKWQQT